MNMQDAIDAMLGIVDAAAITVTGGPMLMMYEDKINPAIPNGIPASEVLWARAIVRHATGAASSLTGAEGAIKYLNTGIVWVQIFAPKGDGLVLLRAAAETVQNAFRTARLDVWFRDMQAVEMGSDGAFERMDVKAKFEYDVIK